MQAAVLLDPERSARVAGLQYADPGPDGIRRIRRGSGFVYVDARGRTVRDTATLARIRSLAIPPAWTDVRIALSPQAHLQALGRDARGRKQYRYHPQWRAFRDRTKYARLSSFGKALPRIRRRVARDVRLPGLGRAKVLATLVQLLERTLIRVGNEEYVKANGSFGLTTMRDRHAVINGSAVTFKFKGKSGLIHCVTLQDARLAKIVRRCQELPGQVLFQYTDDDGSPGSISSTDLNDYLRGAAGGEFTAKDFRTWFGTLLAAKALSTVPPPASASAGRRQVVRAVEEVASVLGNTVAVCRKCYVHPAVIEAYLDGSLANHMRTTGPRNPGLAPDEAALLKLLSTARSIRTC